jgi:thioredoxin 1
MKVIYFSTAFCQPCKTLKPLVQEVAAQLGTQVEYVDAQNQREFAESLGVSSVPTLVGTRNGTVVFKHVGLTTKERLLQLFKQI